MYLYQNMYVGPSSSYIVHLYFFGNWKNTILISLDIPHLCFEFVNQWWCFLGKLLSLDKGWR